MTTTNKKQKYGTNTYGCQYRLVPSVDAKIINLMLLLLMMIIIILLLVVVVVVVVVVFVAEVVRPICISTAQGMRPFLFVNRRTRPSLGSQIGLFQPQGAVCAHHHNLPARVVPTLYFGAKGVGGCLLYTSPSPRDFG